MNKQNMIQQNEQLTYANKANPKSQPSILENQLTSFINDPKNIIYQIHNQNSTILNYLTRALGKTKHKYTKNLQLGRQHPAP